MNIRIQPDPDDKFMIINVDGSLTAVENPHQDIDFSVYTAGGRLLKSGKSADELHKALAELKVIENLDHLEELQERIEAHLAAEENKTIAARSLGNTLEIADYPDSQDLTISESELEWVKSGQAIPNIKPPLR